MQKNPVKLIPSRYCYLISRKGSLMRTKVKRINMHFWERERAMKIKVFNFLQSPTSITLTNWFYFKNKRNLPAIESVTNSKIHKLRGCIVPDDNKVEAIS